MRWAVYFMVLIHSCDLKKSVQICRKMGLAPRYSRILCQERLKAQRQLYDIEQQRPKKASILYHQLHNYRTELILYMMATTRKRAVKKSISYYYNQLRNVQLSISGKDLIAAGLEPGPQFSQILQTVLDAKLNGEVETHKDELRFLRQLILAFPSHNFLDSKPLSQ